jgi:tRNA (guanine37-N1)-methyltransferase
VKIDVLTLFPEFFPGALGASILGLARERGLVEYRLVNIRDFANDRHKVCDDTPYGGGPGMVMKPEPLAAAIGSVKDEDPDARVILLSPRGRVYKQTAVRELAGMRHLALVCGHYKDIDERVRSLVDDDISLGDYILSGGEPAALALIDSVVRLLPGAISDPESAQRDSFENGLLDHPHYTRPEEFRGMKVPEVLRSGNHARIAEWRRRESLRLTLKFRPELLERAGLDDRDREMLDKLKGAGI